MKQLQRGHNMGVQPPPVVRVACEVASVSDESAVLTEAQQHTGAAAASKVETNEQEASWRQVVNAQEVGNATHHVEGCYLRARLALRVCADHAGAALVVDEAPTRRFWRLVCSEERSEAFRGPLCSLAAHSHPICTREKDVCQFTCCGGRSELMQG